MLGTLRHGTHHFGDLIFTTMERTFLTAGVVVLTLAALLDHVLRDIPLEISGGRTGTTELSISWRC